MKNKVLFSLLIALMFIGQNVCAKEAEPKLELRDLGFKSGKSKAGKQKLEQEFTMEETMQQIQNYMKAANDWKRIKCVPKTRFVCTKHDCKKIEVERWLVLDKNEGTVSRCENENNCNTYKADFAQSGININIQAEEPMGTLVKVLGNNRYKEILTVGLDAYVSNGECEIF